jgi:hypothetical protein
MAFWAVMLCSSSNFAVCIYCIIEPLYDLCILLILRNVNAHLSSCKLTEWGKKGNKFAENITFGKVFHINVPKILKTLT